MKHRILKIFNWRTFEPFISFKIGLACVYLSSYKSHEQTVSDNDKDVQAYF